MPYYRKREMSQRTWLIHMRKNSVKKMEELSKWCEPRNPVGKLPGAKGGVSGFFQHRVLGQGDV